jgi:DNA-directed RNA polymerase subunit RPC12/RpoP
MMELARPMLARVQALLAALASWIFVLWLAGLPFVASHSYGQSYFYVGLAILAVLWVWVIVTSIPLMCPYCGKRISFTSKPARLSPDWQALREQFMPIDALRGNRSIMVCPHCGGRAVIFFGGKRDA